MRDDLHRTVSLPRRWQTVLRYLPRPADSVRASEAMLRAVQIEIAAEVSESWTNEMEGSIDAARQDLFPQQRLRQLFDDGEAKCRNKLQRQILENARGLRARDGDSGGLFPRAVDVTARQVAVAYIENATSQVRNQHGTGQAREVRERLEAILSELSFRSLDKTPSKSPKKRIDLDLLNESIALDQE